MNSITPKTGLKIGGTRLIIRGTNFIQSEFLNCKLGNNLGRSIKLLSPNEIECITPAVTDISNGYEVSLTLNGIEYFKYELAGEIPFLYYYHDPIEVISVEPNFAFTTTFQIHLLVLATNIKIHDQVYCKIHDFITAGNILLLSESAPSEVECIIPSYRMLKKGAINPFTNAVNVDLSNNGIISDFSNSEVKFTFLETVDQITLVDHWTGPDSGNTVIDIQLDHFPADIETQSFCIFGDVSVSPTDLGNYKLRCITPSLYEISLEQRGCYNKAPLCVVDFVLQLLENEYKMYFWYYYQPVLTELNYNNVVVVYIYIYNIYRGCSTQRVQWRSRVRTSSTFNRS